jgi:hypothetical protein
MKEVLVMKGLRNSVLASLLVVTGLVSIASAQGPLNKRVNYSISAEHALRMGDYILPAGDYILFQINQNDTNLFALYQGDNMMHSPIAMIRTTRIYYPSGRTPEKTHIMLEIDEESNTRGSTPVLKGWTIPGLDGFEIISVVEGKKGVLARVQ